MLNQLLSSHLFNKPSQFTKLAVNPIKNFTINSHLLKILQKLINTPILLPP